MKEKYADQDEEEREMRLALLGAKKVKGFDIDEFAEKKHGFQKDESTTQDQESGDEGGDGEDEEFDGEEEKVDEELNVDLLKDQAEIDPDAIIEENEEEDNNNDEDEDESRQIQQILIDEDITIMPESQDISELDKLTGQPGRKDGLLFGIPMLAPYSTIQSYKYKVKIMPGTMKRGRVQKTIKDLFMKNAKESKVETQMIKSINDQDMTMVLVNNCKVAAAGLTQIQQQAKANKKAQNKPKKD